MNRIDVGMADEDEDGDRGPSARYVKGRKLGEGQFGVVYLATDTQARPSAPTLPHDTASCARRRRSSDAGPRSPCLRDGARPLCPFSCALSRPPHPL